MAENKGRLYLIPSPLGENDPAEVIPLPVLKSLDGFRTFVVEEVRTARRYLSKAGLKGRIGANNFLHDNYLMQSGQIPRYGATAFLISEDTLFTPLLASIISHA